MIRERLMAESQLETEVLRQAILADKWDLPPEHLKMIGPECHAHAARLCSGGGQAVFHPDFSRDVVFHYRVGQQLPNGFYELQVGLIEKRSGRPAGEFKLRSCLALLRNPPFQTGWNGPPRQFYVCPWWYYFSNEAQPRGVVFHTDVRDFYNGALFISSLAKCHAEWDCLPPHMQLIQPPPVLDTPIPDASNQPAAGGQH